MSALDTPFPTVRDRCALNDNGPRRGLFTTLPPPDRAGTLVATGTCLAPDVTGLETAWLPHSVLCTLSPATLAPADCAALNKRPSLVLLNATRFAMNHGSRHTRRESYIHRPNSARDTQIRG